MNHPARWLAAARWRVDVRCYAVALFTAPLIVLVTLLALVSADFLPELFGADAKAALLLAGIAVGLVAGLEELGWAGFAVPVLAALRRSDGSGWSWGSCGERGTFR
jgi:hypothetical protein